MSKPFEAAPMPSAGSSENAEDRRERNVKNQETDEILKLIEGALEELENRKNERPGALEDTAAEAVRTTLEADLGRALLKPKDMKSFESLRAVATLRARDEAGLNDRAWLMGLSQEKSDQLYEAVSNAVRISVSWELEKQLSEWLHTSENEREREGLQALLATAVEHDGLTDEDRARMLTFEMLRYPAVPEKGKAE